MWQRLKQLWRRPQTPLTLGQRGELAAERFLKKLGYKIIVRGDRTALGEIDIVAVDGRTVVFVEVKTRQSHEFGHPLEAVDQHKQEKLTRLGLAYLKRHGLLECSARFDVVAVTWPGASEEPRIEHFIDAFPPTDKLQMFS
jgi:putative endonuclease